MSTYRIEVSTNNRAGCQDSVCKATASKCLKGQLRFGTWTEIKEHGSFRWKHWGCVSGKQIEGLRDTCSRDGGAFEFDAIDGYDEMADYPDLQAKIREAVEQGHIAPEDFNGDPEYNKLGQRAIRGRAAVNKAKAEENGDAPKDGETAGDAEKPPAKGKKRSRKAAAADEEPEALEDTKPKKRIKIVPAPVKDEESEEEKPKPKVRGKAAKAVVKAEESEEEKPKPMPKAKAKIARAAVKKEESEAETEEAPVAEPKAKRGKAAAAVKAEDEEEPKSKRGGKRAAAKKAIVEESEAEDDEEEEEPAPRPKAKKAAAAKGGKRAKAAAADEIEAPAAAPKRRSRRSAGGA
ncbi:hypothetical protein ACHAQH_003936 [Verticillium albo-atrum]